MKRPKTRYQSPKRKWLGCRCRVHGFAHGFEEGVLVEYNKSSYTPWVILLDNGFKMADWYGRIEVDTWTSPRFKKVEDKEYEDLLI